MLPPRLSLLVLPVVLTATLSACGSDDDSTVTAPPAASAPSAAASPEASPIAPSTGTDVPDDTQPAQEVQLTVAGGKVSGDTGRVQVKVGSRVRLTVLSDVADEIHLHGYDLSQDVSANQPAQLEFVADKPGVYEVELEESRTQLTRLQVQ